MEQYQMEPYDEKTGKGLLRHVLIRYGFTTKEIMVCLVINAKKSLIVKNWLNYCRKSKE